MSKATLEPAGAAPRGRLARFVLQLSRDKADTLLLLGAVVLVLAPHAAHLPAWITIACAMTLAWRAVITLRGLRMPPSMILVPISFIAMVGIFMTYRSLLGRESGVAMAVLLLAFKMLEMKARRDLFVVVYLAYFLLLANFLDSQSIAMALMGVCAIIALLTAQLTFQYTGVVPPLKKRLLLGGKMLGIAAPVAIALFFLFPRIQGPLWGLPTHSPSARTGLSADMSPGTMSNLAQSTEIAFRAKFNGNAPEQSRLYWRAIVMGDFDGLTWTRSAQRELQGEQVLVRGPALDYQVTLEPHGRRWLLALDLPTAVPQLVNNMARMSGDLELRSVREVTERIRYDARSHLLAQAEAGPTLPDSERWLKLPRGFNPKAMQAGLDLQRYGDPAERAQVVLKQFREGGFSYTLQPPLLGKNTVDEFLYQTKAGFCEHYASAFVFLMRAADIPARVVTGYQGGEINPIDGFMVVRQSDAHAWTEIWLKERGWTRVDPTAAVSPDRIERNLARALPPSEAGFANLGLIELGIDSDSLLAQLRFRLNAINTGWNQSVLNYDRASQRSLVDALIGSLTETRTLAGIAAMLLLLVVVHTLRVRAQTDPVDALYSALCQRMGRLGVTRARDEGPTAYGARVAASTLAPQRKEATVRFLQLYSAYKYGPGAADPHLVSTLKKLLNGSQ